MGFLYSTFRRRFRLSAGNARRYVRRPNLLRGEPLEPRQCLSADGLPGGIYEAGNLNQADIAMLADVARARYGVDGEGIKIGILSVSFNNLGGADYDIAHGTLPDRVQVLHDNLASNESDEGRAMAQLVHAIAPAAELSFSAGWDSSLPKTPQNLLVTWQDQFAKRIGELVEAGCTIIVDDLGIPLEPWFQDGPISRAIDEAVRRGTTYFVSASNDSNFSYESTFHPVAPPAELLNHQDFAGRSLQFHDFDPGDAVEVFQRITLPSGAKLDEPFVIQWDQPWGQNNSTVEAWFFDQNKTPIGKAVSDPAYPAAIRLFVETPNPAGGTNLPAIGSDFYLAFTHVLDGSEPPGFLKWIASLDGPGTLNGTRENGSVEFTTFGAGTAVGHFNSLLGASVGAAPYWETPAYGEATPQLTAFSSWGGTPIFFDASGRRLESPDYRSQPRFVAPQDVDTTFFPGPDTDTDLDRLPNFSGTSAAAPNAAAVAALMLQLDPSLTPTEIYRILASTAVSMPSPYYAPQGVSESYNFATGAGMIHAERALAEVAGLAIRGTVFEDFDRNGVQSGDELPLAGVKVFLDSNGNGIRDQAPSPGSGVSFVKFEAVAPTPVREAERVANPNRQLTDQQADSYLTWPAKAYGGVDVTAMPGTVTDLEVSFTLRPGSTAETGAIFFVTLVNPAGIRVPLVGTTLNGGTFWNPRTQPPGPTMLFGTDPQTVNISSSSSLVNLAAFSTMPANGEWYLEVMNPDPSRTYTLENWSLSLRTAEQSITTDNDGNYVFPSQVLSLASGVGSFLPTIELPDSRRLTAGLPARPIELRVGENKTANFSISLPLIERPHLQRSATLRIAGNILGPQPVSFSWADLSASLLVSSSGMRLFVTAVSGRVEKLIDGQWTNVGSPPDSGSPRELMRLLALRMIKPGDQLRWLPPAQASVASSAFSVIGWDGLALSDSDSTIYFESISGSET